ncbi:MAG: hypothetical protein WBA74_24600 [Cyclobacteriaceae bacterium]
MNYYPAKKIKEWCYENLSPLAWQRIILKALPNVDQSVNYEKLEDPAADYMLDETTLNALNNATEQIYKVSLPVFRDTNLA